MIGAVVSSADPHTQPADSRAFVGRRRELAELCAGLDDVARGRGRFFLIMGEPGIGKTRLVEELAHEMTRRQGIALWGRCWEGAGAPPYWPWVQVVRAYVRATSEERPTLVGAGGPYLVQLVPELGERFRGDSPAMRDLEAENARFYLFDAVTTLLRTAAEQTPVVVAVDDLQWADTASLLLMQFLARHLVDARIMLLGTYREVDLQENPALADVMGALGREASHLPLRGFDEDEVRLFIESTTGRSTPATVARAVHRNTEGNPFFVDEMIRLLVAERAIERMAEASGEKFPVPHGVREAILRRINALPPPCREALTLAAVIGREFDLTVLQRASELGGDALLETLGPALVREIVVREGPGSSRYRFAHALIRETLYEELAPADRARLHARVGAVLEELHRHDPGPHLAALAHHFLAAIPTVSADKAILYSVRAGRHAAASLGYEAAAAHFADALAALEGARPHDDRERCEILLARGDAQWKSADGRGARETFGEAASVARRIGDAQLLARSALGFAGEGSRLFWVRSGIVDRQRIDLLEEAIHALGDGEPTLRARLLARLAINLYWSQQPERILAVSAAAVDLARQLDDARTLAAVLRARWVALWRPDTAEERLAIADEIISLGERTHDRELVLLGRRYRIVAFFEFGDVAAADREIATWELLAHELRQPLHRADVAMWRATRAIMDGRFAEGEACARLARELGEREPELEAPMRYAVQTGVLHFHRGQLDEVVSAATAAPYTSATMLLQSHRILLASEGGHETKARRELSALGTDGFPLPSDGGLLVYMSLLAAAAANLEDRASAAALYDLLCPYGDRLAVMGAGLTCWGSVAHYLGLLAATLGRDGEAKEQFAKAATVHERIGARPFLAWTYFAHGRLLARSDRGARSEATTLLTKALAIAQELGMDRLVAKIGALAVAEPEAHELAASEPQPRSQGDAIFRREGDVWSVVFAGKAVQLRHAKGLADLAILLANPGRQIHVAELIAASAPPTSDPRGVADLAAQGTRAAVGTSTDAVLDRRARDDYRARLGELQLELEDAERCNDEGRALRARAELDFIAGELAAAFGLGGRARRAASPVERARKAVASRIRFSIAHIARLHPALADHLRRYVRTGTVCTYVVPDDPVHWSF